MKTEKRLYTRVEPDHLSANITLECPETHQYLTLSGKVLDISYRGIKVCLNHEQHKDLNQCKIKIKLVLPGSKIPITISGRLQHGQNNHFGIEFVGPLPEQALDSLLFECVKDACQPDPVQISQTSGRTD